MPSKIDHNLIPPVIREAVDPDILARAQSIEWSINRDTGEDEHGFLDGSNEDYLSSQNLLKKSHHLQQPSSPSAPGGNKRKMVEWLDQSVSGRDSGFEHTPTSPSLGGGKGSAMSHHNDNALSFYDDFGPTNVSKNSGSMKRHPQGQYPFPIYKVNQEQLQGDVTFEVAPRAKPGERTVHYEKSSRVMNQEELDALGLDPNFFGPNTKTTMDEQEEEMIETSV